MNKNIAIIKNAEIAIDNVRLDKLTAKYLIETKKI